MQWIIKCWTIAAPIFSPGGKWIPYTARQVMLRRAARLVCVAIPLGAVGPTAIPVLPPELPMLTPLPQSGWLYSPGEFIPQPFEENVPVAEVVPPSSIIETTPIGEVAEPSSLSILIIGFGLTLSFRGK